MSDGSSTESPSTSPNTSPTPTHPNNVEDDDTSSRKRDSGYMDVSRMYKSQPVETIVLHFLAGLQSHSSLRIDDVRLLDCPYVCPSVNVYNLTYPRINHLYDILPKVMLFANTVIAFARMAVLQYFENGIQLLTCCVIIMWRIIHYLTIISIVQNLYANLKMYNSSIRDVFPWMLNMIWEIMIPSYTSRSCNEINLGERNLTWCLIMKLMSAILEPRKI